VHYAVGMPTTATADPLADPLALDRQVCFALVTTARRVVSIYGPVLEPLGLTHPQYLVMLALWERTPRRVRELADALYLEPATLSPLLKRLEAAGLIERRRNADDDRALAVSLTPAGAALRERALAVPGQIMERLGVGIPELERMRDALNGILAATQ
jgi:MarR family transcriptional regulator, organic hydroperoxide resistance regulator